MYVAGIILTIVNKVLSNVRSKQLLEEMQQNNLKD